MRYDVKVTQDSVIKVFVDNEGEEFIEIWVRSDDGFSTYKTTGKGIISKLEERGKLENLPEELQEALEEDDFLTMMDFFASRI